MKQIHCADMVGKMQNVETRVQSMKNNDEKARLKFQLFDGRYDSKFRH